MALKPARNYQGPVTDIHWFMNVVGNRGGCVVKSLAGSGDALDQSAQLVTYAIPTSGAKAIGILLNDMVDIDQTRQHKNFYKDEVVLGSKVTILRRGVVNTDQITSGVTVDGGDPCYLDAGNTTANGRLTNVLHPTGGEAVTPQIGQFISHKDEDGYASVEDNLP